MEKFKDYSGFKREDRMQLLTLMLYLYKDTSLGQLGNLTNTLDKVPTNPAYYEEIYQALWGKNGVVGGSNDHDQPPNVAPIPNFPLEPENHGTEVGGQAS